MRDTRRTFLAEILIFGAAAIAGAAQQRQQGPPEPGTPPDMSRERSREPPGLDVPPPHRDPRKVMKENADNVKKDVARLVELANELQDAVAHDDTTDVLPLDMVRKAEEMEKLAKQVRDLLRG